MATARCGRLVPVDQRATTTETIATAYTGQAELYAELFIDEISKSENAQRWLTTFADLAGERDGPVLDLGCGPGHVTNYLTGLGVHTVGYDISTGQIHQARLAFPAGEYHVGDITALPHSDASCAGIVSRFSIIHLAPEELPSLFEEWIRVLVPGAPALISFFGSLTPDAHGTPFDHKVVTAHELFPTTVARHLEAAGFDRPEMHTLPPVEGGRPFDRATLLARRPLP